MTYFTSAIYQLYPQVVRTVGDEVFDADGNPVAYDRAAVEREAQIMDVRANRAAAYAAEADPLFFKSQRGEATTDEWTAKVAEIKARFPYPDGGEE